MQSNQEKSHLYLVDGSGYIFRAYHALPPLTRKSDNMPTRRRERPVPCRLGMADLWVARQENNLRAFGRSGFHE